MPNINEILYDVIGISETDITSMRTDRLFRLAKTGNEPNFNRNAKFIDVSIRFINALSIEKLKSINGYKNNQCKMLEKMLDELLKITYSQNNKTTISTPEIDAYRDLYLDQFQYDEYYNIAFNRSINGNCLQYTIWIIRHILSIVAIAVLITDFEYTDTIGSNPTTNNTITNNNIQSKKEDILLFKKFLVVCSAFTFFVTIDRQFQTRYKDKWDKDIISFNSFIELIKAKKEGAEWIVSLQNSVTTGGEISILMDKMKALTESDPVKFKKFQTLANVFESMRQDFSGDNFALPEKIAGDWHWCYDGSCLTKEDMNAVCDVIALSKYKNTEETINNKILNILSTMNTYARFSAGNLPDDGLLFPRFGIPKYINTTMSKF